MESFPVLVKSYSISPVRLQRIMKKALFPRLLRSLLITYSGKRKYSIVLVKSLKKVLNFGSQNLYEHCTSTNG